MLSGSVRMYAKQIPASASQKSHTASATTSPTKASSEAFQPLLMRSFLKLNIGRRLIISHAMKNVRATTTGQVTRKSGKRVEHRAKARGDAEQTRGTSIQRIEDRGEQHREARAVPLVLLERKVERGQAAAQRRGGQQVRDELPDRHLAFAFFGNSGEHG